MSRYINIDDISLRKTISVGGLSAKALWRRIQQAPSIDIVFCKECKWSKANGTYQWCGRLDSTAQITADDFCSYGERREP